MATDGPLSGLLAELRGAGEVDSLGRFTLDRAQARAKMRRFQLVDARRYVLELVQAAALRGATRVDFEVDADDMFMRFDGREFTAAELDDLWGSIFAEGDEPGLRGLRQLALGLNAALGLGPARIFVYSGDQRLLLRPDRDEALAPGERAIAGTAIHVEKRLTLSLLVDVLRNVSGTLGEELHLHERCRHASLAISLDGESIVRGLHVEGAIVEQPIAAPGVRGVVGLVAGARLAELRLLKDGVWIDSRPLAQCGPGVVAIVEGERLRKDVSLARIVDDEALAAVVELVRAARWGLFARLVEAAEREPHTSEPALARVRAEALQFLELGDIHGRPDAASVARAIVWSDARTGGPGGPRRVSLAELAALAGGMDAAQQLRSARRDHPLLPAEGAPIPRLGAKEVDAVARVLGRTIVAVDDALARASKREQGRRAWAQRTMAPNLPSGRAYAARATIAAPGVHGELGLDAPGSAPHKGTLWLIREGCLLTRLELDWDIAGLDVALAAAFTPNDDHDDAVRDATLVEAVLHALAGLLGPLTQLVAAARGDAEAAAVRGLVKGWLALVLDDGQRDGLWQRLAVPVPLRPDAAAVQAVLPGPAELCAGSPRLAAIVAAPLFEDFDGARRSLAELVLRHTWIGALDELDRGVAPEPGLGDEVAWLGHSDRRILAGLLGAGSLRSWAPTLAARRRERAFWAAPPTSIAAIAARMADELRAAGLDPALWCRTLAVDGVEAVITLAATGAGSETFARGPGIAGNGAGTETVARVPGIARGGATPRLTGPALRTMRVDLLHVGRPLATRTLEPGIGPLVAVATSTALCPRSDWEGVGDDAALATVDATLRQGAWALLDGLVRGHAGQPAGWSWLRGLLRARLGEPDVEALLASLPALRTLPLLTTLSGASLSLGELDAEVRERGQIAWVPPDTPRVEVPGPPILCEEPALLDGLRAWVGAAALVDGRERLRMHAMRRRFDELPAVERATLAPGKVWAAVALTGGEPAVTGEVGLSRARSEGGLVVELCTGGRRVGVATQDDVPAPVEAIVADPALPLDADLGPDRRSKRYGQHLRRCRRAVPRLIVGLCERFAELRGAEREQARALLLGYAAQMPADGSSQVGSEAAAARAAVAALPLLVDVWGAAHTLAEVEERSKPRGCVEVVGTAVEAPSEAAGLERLILQADAPARRCLAARTRLKDLSGRWAEEVQAMRALARAPRFTLPNVREVAWVERRTLVTGGLQAHLWICRTPRDTDAVVFTRGDREVGRLGLIMALPCAGVVRGDGLIADEGAVQLDARQRGSLAKQICLLYEALARQVQTSGRMNADERERALAWLLHVDAALAMKFTALPDGPDRPFEQLRAALAELAPPAVRRSRDRSTTSTASAAGDREAPTGEAAVSGTVRSGAAASGAAASGAAVSGAATSGAAASGAAASEAAASGVAAGAREAGAREAGAVSAPVVTPLVVPPTAGLSLTSIRLLP